MIQFNIMHGRLLFQVTALALLLLGPVAGVAVATEQPDFFGVPPDSLAGRFHRLAFGPAREWYVRHSFRDSVRAEIESLLVERLRAVGFEVVDPHVGVAICRQIGDSLGWNFNPSPGRVNREREAVLHIQTIRTLLDRHSPDGLIYWAIAGSGDLSIRVWIDESGGNRVYVHEVGIGGTSFGELLRARPRCAEAVKKVLDPFCKATLRK